MKSARLTAAVVLVAAAASRPPAPAGAEEAAMTREQVSSFAKLALRAVTTEFPNKPADVLNDAKDARPPRDLHPAFYGSFDWHSSVHGHWMLVRLLRLFPDLPEAKKIRSVLNAHLTAENLKSEAD